MHEGILYEGLGEDKVKCTACKHKCVIAPGKSGICGVRVNKDGKLFLIVYGKATGVNIDPIEKKLLYHFLPGTDIFSLGTVGCNFKCDFCQNWDMSQKIDNLGQDLLPEQIIEICLEKKIPSIAYTYNEPTIFFEYLYDTAKLAKKKGIKNILVTNGYESDEALEKMKGLIDAMNIDLKSFSNDFYKKLCKAKLQPVLDTIKKAYELGFWIEITTLIIPGKNDSKEELEKIAKFIANIDKNIPWHLSAFHPDYKMTNVLQTGREILERAYEIGKNVGLKFVYVGNVVDEDRSATYCPKCSSVLIKRPYFNSSIENFKDGKCSECGEKIKGVWK